MFLLSRNHFRFSVLVDKLLALFQISQSIGYFKAKSRFERNVPRLK
jgi:hypothetical protein